MSLVILVEDSKIPNPYEILESGHAAHHLEHFYPKPPFQAQIVLGEKLVGYLVWLKLHLRLSLSM